MAISAPAFYPQPVQYQPMPVMAPVQLPMQPELPFNPFGQFGPAFQQPSFQPTIQAPSAPNTNMAGVVQGLPPMPMTGSPEILSALNVLADIRHLPLDEEYMRHLGVNVVFPNGQEALKLILEKNVRVEFGDMGDTKAHAQWIKDQNLIMINQKYKGDLSKANIYAIAEAIYHEAGHAALLGDDRASVQEEIDCLALNTLAYRFHSTVDPEFAQSTNNSRLIQDGVALYSRFFFDQDPWKRALVNRVIEKYGMLPPATPDHPIPILPDNVPLADRVVRQIHANNTLNMVA